MESPADRNRPAPKTPAAESSASGSALVVLFGPGPSATTAVEIARRTARDVQGLHVRSEADDTLELRRFWERTSPEIPLIILPADKKAIAPPILQFVQSIRQDTGSLTVVLAEEPDGGWLTRFSRQRSITGLKKSLGEIPGVTVTSINTAEN